MAIILVGVSLAPILSQLYIYCDNFEAIGSSDVKHQLLNLACRLITSIDINRPVVPVKECTVFFFLFMATR